MADILETPENPLSQAPIEGAAAPSAPSAGTGSPGVPAAPGASPALGEPAPASSVMKKVLAYGKKNWWLILLPLPVIVIVMAVKHRRK